MSTHFFRRTVLAAAVVCVGFWSDRAVALEPDEIALVVNSAEPIGKELAQFYAAQRHVPANRILELNNVPVTDEMTNRDYQESVVPQVREFLKSGNLASKVKCLVTFYGVPLRIAGRSNTADENLELDQIRRTLVEMPNRLRPAVEAAEAVAVKVSPSYVPMGSPTDLVELEKRWVVAYQTILEGLKTVPDGKSQNQILAEYWAAVEPLLGKEAIIRKEQADLLVKAATTQAVEPPSIQAEVADLNKLAEGAGKLESMQYDAQARGKLRSVLSANFGLLRYVRLLKDQADFLDPDMSSSAFDSELAMVLSPVYLHKGWMPNPLNYQAKSSPNVFAVMVARLDAPTPDLVKSIVATSIKVEQNGLAGKVVIDSLGVKAGQELASQRGYGVYDQFLRNLDQTLHSSTKLDVLLDEKPEVLPAGSATDVALYCGWHSARAYVPACKFSQGAVGYHIASYELISLRGPNETGWVHGLLTDGVCATLGPVAEPYLGAFPRPDEFFPLLLTGKLTVAETYWKTEPSTSWMMAFIGDPLYNPYKKNPQLSPGDLPYRLRAALNKPAVHH